MWLLHRSTTFASRFPTTQTEPKCTKTLHFAIVGRRNETEIERTCSELFSAFCTFIENSVVTRSSHWVDSCATRREIIRCIASSVALRDFESTADRWWCGFRSQGLLRGFCFIHNCAGNCCIVKVFPDGIRWHDKIAAKNSHLYDALDFQDITLQQCVWYFCKGKRSFFFVFFCLQKEYRRRRVPLESRYKHQMSKGRRSTVHKLPSA